MVLSRRHCVIDERPDGYFITDNSSNGIYLNRSEKPLGKGNSARLNDGDRLALGEYIFKVGINTTVAIGLHALPEARPPAARSDPFPGTNNQSILSNTRQKAPASDFEVADSADPFADFSTPAELAPEDDASLARNETADPLGLEQAPPPRRRPSVADHVPAEQEFLQVPRARAQSLGDQAPVGSRAADFTPKQREIIPSLDDDSLIQQIKRNQLDEFMPEPLRAEPVVEAEPAASPASAALSPEDPLYRTDVIAPIDGKQPIPAAKPATPTPHQAAAEQPVPLSSPSAEAEPAPPVPTAPSRTIVRTPIDSAPDLAPVATAPRTAHPSAGPPAAANVADSVALKAFFRGAGLQQLELRPEEAAQVMHMVGVLLRTAVDGMMNVLRARSTIRNELRVERTIVGLTANPLKALPSAEDALHVMLTKRGGAWLSPAEALREGFDDIKAHEVAMVAGMQAAIAALLAKLDPQQFEQALGAASKLDLLTGGRKAKCWDEYQRRYRELRELSVGDAREPFGREFAKAYETQQRDYFKKH